MFRSSIDRRNFQDILQAKRNLPGRNCSVQPARPLTPPPSREGSPAPRATPAPAPRPTPAPGAGASVSDDRWLLAFLFAIPIGITVWGVRYYTMPFGARMRHPLHDVLKPSGVIGLWLGVLGLALFLFMWLYPMRKKYRWLAWTGALGSWMRIHVLAGLWVPLVVAVHAGWRFDGLIGLGYFAMLLVSLSGVVGRYLYVRIPRSKNGLELSLDEVSGERRALVTRIAVATGLDPIAVERSLATDPRSYAGLGPLQTLVLLFKDDLARARALKSLRRDWSKPAPGRRALDRGALDAAIRLARREMSLSQQVRVLEATRRVFGYWHVAHRPVAITAFLAVAIHVVVAVAIGGVGGGVPR
jgi:hypothetical protein